MFTTRCSTKAKDRPSGYAFSLCILLSKTEVSLLLDFCRLILAATDIQSVHTCLQGLRAQIDRILYKKHIQSEVMNNTPNLSICAAPVEDLILEQSPAGATSAPHVCCGVVLGLWAPCIMWQYVCTRVILEQSPAGATSTPHVWLWSCTRPVGSLHHVNLRVCSYTSYSRLITDGKFELNIFQSINQSIKLL